MSVAEQVDSLERAVAFGLLNGKRNVVADLVPLDELFQQRRELLAALEDIIEYADRDVRRLNEQMVGGLYPAINSAKIERAREAIHKAKGDRP